MVSSSQRSKFKRKVAFFLTCTGGPGVDSAIFFATGETAAGLLGGFGVCGLGEDEVGIGGDELEGIGELDVEEVPNLASLFRRIFQQHFISFSRANAFKRLSYAVCVTLGCWLIYWSVRHRTQWFNRSNVKRKASGYESAFSANSRFGFCFNINNFGTP